MQERKLAAGKNQETRATAKQIIPSEKPKLPAWYEQAQLNGKLRGASARGNNAEITRLIKVGGDIAAADEDGMTALHWAAWHGHTQTCIFLIEQYAKFGGNVKKIIAAKDNERRTPLSYATGNGHTKTEQFLKSMPQLHDLLGKATFGSFLSAFSECTA